MAEKSLKKLSACAVAWLVATIVHSAAALGAADPVTTQYTGSSTEPSAQIRLSGHVPDAVRTAARTQKALSTDAEEIALTIVLRRTDEPGFQSFLAEVYDPRSPLFRRFMTAGALADRFGPSAADYAAIRAYFAERGLVPIDESSNRMTLSVKGPRSAVEQALGVRIGDYRIGEKSFHSNDSDPVLPQPVAVSIQAVVGMNGLARPAPTLWEIKKAFECTEKALKLLNTNQGQILTYDQNAALERKKTACLKAEKDAAAVNGPEPTITDPPPPAWFGLQGAGQKIGVVAFDTFDPADVADYISFAGLPVATINNLQQVHVGGGATAGPDQSEVLLDLAALVGVVSDANITIYDAPFSGAGSFQSVFNAMINDNVNVISNSWAYCENQTTLSDVQSIESILQTAAAAGISVVTGSGDRGSTCLDGSANTTHVPASSPHITAVGASDATDGPGFTYGTETWWDDSAGTPPGGQGGFGASGYFARPAYQDAHSAGSMRSIPDLVANGAPRHGITICQASQGGCPTGLLYGGTSYTAPLMAAFAALLNEAQGTSLGFLNPALYPMSGTDAFHGAAGMGTDFAHVGLGSPNLGRIHTYLTSQTPGTPVASVSRVVAYTADNFKMPPTLNLPLPAYADGATTTYVVVKLFDVNGNYVSGKNVTLSASAGSHALITPASVFSSADNGAAIFAITDLTPETITFTATDTTDNIVVDQTADVEFVTPPAANAGIQASPSSAPANGSTISTITITLTDSLNRPTPGKRISLSEGNGHSIITGPNPPVTDVNGQIHFNVTNNVNETVTYSAIDETDGFLPVPGTTSVTFTGSGSSCVGASPVAGSGFALTAFANGFPAQNFFYSNVNWSACPGVSNPAFDTGGNVLVSDFFTGDLYKFGAGGGAVSSGSRLASLGPTLEQPAYGTDGKLYAAHGATGGGFTTGNVIQIDPATGAVVRTLVSGLTCPSALAVDPLSGDLFFTDTCSGAGSDNPSLWRISGPGGATPTLSVYATLPATPNGSTAFAPNGTIYVVTGYSGAGSIVRITGTNIAGPPTMTTLAGISSDGPLTMGESLADGSARSLIVHNSNSVKKVDITTVPFITTVMATGIYSSGTIGPDGCLYTGASDTIYRITPASGPCSFAPSNTAPSLLLTPNVPVSNAVQGTSQSLTATFVNATVPSGTAVFFEILGANTQTRIASTDVNGVATTSYAGILTGDDRIVARSTVDTTPQSPLLVSNTALVTWTPGKHLTLLSLGSTISGAVGGSVTLSATLVDTTADPAVPIAGAAIQFVAGSLGCGAATGANGVASCTVMPTAQGIFTLSASFAGDGQYTPASATGALDVLVLPRIDIDGNGSSHPDTDGLLILRYMLGFTGNSLIANAVAADASRTDADSILAYLQDIRLLLDVDGNGTVDALTDGLLIVRYLSGLRGDALTAGAIGPGATRFQNSDIEQYLQSITP